MKFLNWFKKKNGAGLNNVELLKKLRDAIKPVGQVYTYAGMADNDTLYPSQSGHHCLLATCFKLGIVSGADANKLQYPTPFAQHFGCTREDADAIILGNPRHTTGKSYAKAITKLLRKYNYE